MPLGDDWTWLMTDGAWCSSRGGGGEKGAGYLEGSLWPMKAQILPMARMPMKIGASRG